MDSMVAVGINRLLLLVTRVLLDILPGVGYIFSGADRVASLALKQLRWLYCALKLDCSPPCYRRGSLDAAHDAVVSLHCCTSIFERNHPRPFFNANAPARMNPPFTLEPSESPPRHLHFHYKQLPLPLSESSSHVFSPYRHSSFNPLK